MVNKKALMLVGMMVLVVLVSEGVLGATWIPSGYDLLNDSSEFGTFEGMK